MCTLVIPDLFISIKIQNVYGMKYYLPWISKIDPRIEATSTEVEENSFTGFCHENMKECEVERDRIVQILRNSGINTIIV